jgi:hypothetical protein
MTIADIEALARPALVELMARAMYARVYESGGLGDFPELHWDTPPGVRRNMMVDDNVARALADAEAALTALEAYGFVLFSIISARRGNMANTEGRVISRVSGGIG